MTGRVIPLSAFESSVGYAIDVAREMYRHCAAERSGASEMPVGKSIRSYALQCVSPQITDIKIVSVPLSSDGDPAVRGSLSIMQQGDQRVARIAYASELNRCWTRFVVCKELMHLVLDREDAHTNEVFHQLAAMVGPFSNPYAQVGSEMQAMLGALEYLLPFAERPRQLERPRKGSSEDPALAVATKFRLPRSWVDWFYSDEGGYKTMSDEFNRSRTAPPPPPPDRDSN